MTSAYSIRFEPLLSPEWIAVMALAGVAMAAFVLWRGGRGAWARAGLFAAAGLMLLNPSLIEEIRTPQNTVLTVVMDQSPSMRLGARGTQADEALRLLQERLASEEGLEVRVIAAGAQADMGEEDPGTRLYGALEQAMADLAPGQRAGAIIISDGRIHDLPAPELARRWNAPIHGLIAGNRAESDRSIEILAAPRYAFVRENQEVRLRVNDPNVGRGAPVSVRLELGGRPIVETVIPANEDVQLDFTPDRTGRTYLTAHVEDGPQELTRANNDAATAIAIVRDRLRVLLISGQPHAGERVWRNLLKSDPAVDLVHFTILRPAYKADSAPINEVSLITFPVRELFEVKLQEFDLIIFDRDARGGLLGPLHLSNIAEFVRNGGGLLDATGPDLAQPVSFVNSPLRFILPSRPTGIVHQEAFRPSLTDLGRRHPVTSALPALHAQARGTQPSEAPDWGRWFRMADVEPQSGWTIMQGAQNRPLLLLDRVGEGRVAQLLSDQAWLWARGYDGGGPQSELLRRLSHWLMKEPDLEEDLLLARAEAGRILVTRRSLTPDASPVRIADPESRTAAIPMQDDGTQAQGVYTPQAGPGLYRLEDDGGRTALAAFGLLNPKEFKDPTATDTDLAPVAEATGGAVHWIEDGLPRIERTAQGETQSGRGLGGAWIGVAADGEARVAALSRTPLMPALLAVLLLLAAAGFAWWREGR